MNTMASFGAGFLLFVLDILLLALLFRRLCHSNTQIGRYRLLALLGLLKLPLLGVGIYLVLVVWQADMLSFVLGALAALSLVSGTLIVWERRKTTA